MWIPTSQSDNISYYYCYSLAFLSRYLRFFPLNSEINNQPKSRSHAKVNIAPDQNQTCIPHPQSRNHSYNQSVPWPNLYEKKEKTGSIPVERYIFLCWTF